MGQEFFIRSDTLEDKVRQILPSQGGLGQNFDLSASTQIVPIVDLTESAEGSNLRADLQNAYSFDSTTTTNSINSRDTIITNTGYFRILGSLVGEGTGTCKIELSDGSSTKILFQQVFNASNVGVTQCDFTVFCKAGDSVIQESTSAVVGILTATRQIATITGELVNP